MTSASRLRKYGAVMLGVFLVASMHSLIVPEVASAFADSHSNYEHTEESGHVTCPSSLHQLSNVRDEQSGDAQLADVPVVIPIVVAMAPELLRATWTASECTRPDVPIDRREVLLL